MIIDLIIFAIKPQLLFVNSIAVCYFSLNFTFERFISWMTTQSNFTAYSKIDSHYWAKNDLIRLNWLKVFSNYPKIMLKASFQSSWIMLFITEPLWRRIILKLLINVYKMKEVKNEIFEFLLVQHLVKSIRSHQHIFIQL